jgi:hypothetical protein
MGRITLYRAPTGWVADMSSASGAAATFELFGTDQLPTAYTARAGWRTVQAEIARLNPGDAVEVDILSRDDALTDPAGYA